MTLDEAQRDLARAYVGGGPGVVVSAAVWLAAALAERDRGVGTGFAVLFVGGMFIYPIATAACRGLFRRAREASGNRLGRTALESTVAMIAGLFAAWLLLPFRPGLVLPLAAVAVGTHYAVFSTIYGDRFFWALAAAVTVIGLLPVMAFSVPGGVPLDVAVAEGVAGLILTRRAVDRG